MTPVYFKPKQMLAALMLGGVCAAASASDANDLARVLDSLNGNTPSNDSTAADPLHAGVPLANPAVETFGAPGYRTLASNAVVPAADHAAATNPETTPAAPLLIFGSASAPVRENPTANMFRSLTEHSPALGSKATANPASMAENRPALTGEVAPTADITTTIDLPRALDAATENALTTKISRGQADQAQARVMGARAAYYPKVSVIAKTPDKIYGATQGYGRTYDEFAQVSSTIQYTVFDFGRRKNQVQSAKLAADASENAYQSEVELLTYNTSRVYLDVIRYQRLHKIADDYVAQVKRLNQVIDERVKGGLAAQSDAIRGQLALTSAQSRSRQINTQLAKAQQQFRSITGKDALPQTTESVRQLPAIDVQPLIEAAADNNLAVKARRADVESNNALVNVERASRYPRIDLVGTYRKPLQAVASPGSSVMLQVTFDLFDGGLRKSRVNEAVAAKYVAQQQLEQELRNVSDQKQSLQSDWTSARDQWALSIDGEKQALRTLDLYADEFRLGTRQLSDLINAQVDLFTARSDRQQAEYNYDLSTLALYNIDARTKEGLQALNLTKGEM